MKNVALFIALSMTVSAFSISGSTKPSKKKKFDEIHYKALDPIKTDDYWISFEDMHSQDAFIQIKVEFLNKTDDILAIQFDQITFTVDGNSCAAPEKQLLIKPGMTRNFYLKTTEIPGLPAETVEVNFGGISRIPTGGDHVSVEDYPLPDTKKLVKSSDIHIAMTKVKKETKVTDVKWTVTNNGDKPVLMDQSLLTMSVEDGKGEWPTEAVNKGFKIIWPGKTANLKGEFRIPAKTADMQFANLLVHFNKTFRITDLEPVNGATFTMEMDLGKTEAHN